MADSYVVTAAAAYVYRTDGTAVFLLADAPVPDDATAESVAVLLEKGMIAAVPESFVAGGIPNDVPGVPVVADQAAPDDVDGPDGPIPPKSASQSKWADYAISQGADPELARASTKDELIAEFGKAS